MPIRVAIGKDRFAIERTEPGGDDARQIRQIGCDRFRAGLIGTRAAASDGREVGQLQTRDPRFSGIGQDHRAGPDRAFETDCDPRLHRAHRFDRFDADDGPELAFELGVHLLQRSGGNLRKKFRGEEIARRDISAQPSDHVLRPPVQRACLGRLLRRFILRVDHGRNAEGQKQSGGNRAQHLLKIPLFSLGKTIAGSTRACKRLG